MNLKNAGNVLAGWSDRSIDLKEFVAQVEAWQKENNLQPTFYEGEYPNLSVEDIRAGKEPEGMLYSVKFPNGQTLSVIVFQDGQIKRLYTDNGDIPISKVTKLLVGRQTLFKQAQHGGRPTGTGKPIYDPGELLRQLAKSGLSERDFEREYGKSRSSIQRAKKRKLASDNR